MNPILTKIFNFGVTLCYLFVDDFLFRTNELRSHLYYAAPPDSYCRKWRCEYFVGNLTKLARTIRWFHSATSAHFMIITAISMCHSSGIMEMRMHATQHLQDPYLIRTERFIVVQKADSISQSAPRAPLKRDYCFVWTQRQYRAISRVLREKCAKIRALCSRECANAVRASGAIAHSSEFVHIWKADYRRLRLRL